MEEGVGCGATLFRVAGGGGVGFGRGDVLKVPVGVIFNKEDVMFVAQSIEFLAAGELEGDSCRVLADAVRLLVEISKMNDVKRALRDGV